MPSPVFYQLDLIIGFGAPVLAFILYRVNIISRFSWHLFWIGVAIGLTCEIPMFVGSYEAFFVTLQTINPYPIHYLAFMISHTLWDGGLFLIGYGLVLLIAGPTGFDAFSIRELMIFIVYGQVQELMVEFGAVSSGAWTFIANDWNPVLFYVNRHPITLFPQLVWLCASILFYFIVLKLKPKYQQGEFVSPERTSS